MFHKKEDSLAKVMKINDRPIPKTSKILDEKGWNKWTEFHCNMLSLFITEYGADAVRRQAYRLANPKKVEITKIQFPTQK
jgi:hypothetical protein